MDNDDFISFNEESEPKASNPQQFDSPAPSGGAADANGGEAPARENGAPNGQQGSPARPDSGRGGAEGRGRRRRRGRKHGRGGAQNGQGAQRGNQQNSPPRHQHQHHQGGQQQHGGRRHRHRGRDRQPGGAAHGGVFTAPMDHSYRQQPGNEINGNTVDGGRGFSGGGNQRRFGRGQFRGGFQNRNAGMPPAAFGGQVEPVAANGDASTRIFAFIEDLFFVTKINETARKLNVKVEFVKTVDELLEKAGEEKPSLIVVDLNNANAKPLTTIPKLKSQFKKGTSILGFVSHVQGDLKLKAQEAGCDSVLPRSAFSAHLPQILRRHGAPEETLEA